jgi:hypothetical protein
MLDLGAGHQPIILFSSGTHLGWPRPGNATVARLARRDPGGPAASDIRCGRARHWQNLGCPRFSGLDGRPRRLPNCVWPMHRAIRSGRTVHAGAGGVHTSLSDGQQGPDARHLTSFRAELARSDASATERRAARGPAAGCSGQPAADATRNIAGPPIRHLYFLEDLHRSDVSTLELISAVARRTEPARLLIIGTFRPVEMLASEHPLRMLKEELELHQQCKELRLKLLSEESISEYLRARFPEEDAERCSSLASVIHRRTEGNPVFVVSLVDHLLNREASQPNESAILLESARALTTGKNDIPHSILQLIKRNLERLNFEEQSVLETANVAGVEFSAPTIAAALKRSASEIEMCLERLSRHEQFIQANGERVWPDGTPAASFRFLHALYEEVLYKRLSAGRRAELHLRIADRQETAYGVRAPEIASELAYHYGRANQKGKAVEYLQLAGEKAFERGASVETERLNIAH